MAFQRKADASHIGERGGVACRNYRDLLGLDEALGRIHANHLATVTANPRDLAVLHDIDAGLIRAARKTPRNGVVTRHAAATLDGCTEQRIAAIQVDSPLDPLDLFRRYTFRLH